MSLDGSKDIPNEAVRAKKLKRVIDNLSLNGRDTQALTAAAMGAVILAGALEVEVIELRHRLAALESRN
ncbi:hypothetical protein [Rhodococcus sp. BH5]|uniref:hypothetical protein n=1 Tax=Rhodococcus sp. BH5 TaxID=2871702 RepID=UPI0022CD3704|nr:hypothetical protein [Rhodococcus sp. BH5]MCZ9631353.1 hypothetical protein [Rhodococcus sp. BH5]